jgi:Tol biopolymer transport system component
LSTAIVALVASAAIAQSVDVGQIAFLRNHEVWISDRNGRNAKQITGTRGRVDHFAVSPAGDYLAYAPTIRYVDEVGLFEPDDKPGKRGVQSIVIEHLGNRRRIAELDPGDEWIAIDRWLPNGRLIGHSSSGFDVTDVFEFDVASRQRRNLGLERGGRLVEGDVAPDGSLTAYVDDTGLGSTYQQRLHVVDRGSDVVRVSRRSILSPRIARGKGAIGFVEVVDTPGQARDRVWVLNLATSDLRVVHEDIVRSKSWGRFGPVMVVG